MDLVIMLLAAQGLIGAFDNLWHHELTERLSAKPGARREVALHAVREALYAVIFLSLAWFAWQGVWTYVLAAIFMVEIVITLWDFVVEDQSRKLPRFERILHTVLAMNFGAIVILFLPVLADWAATPTAFAPRDYGWWSWLFTAYGLGVAAWAVYDFAVVVKFTVPHWQRWPIRVAEGAADEFPSFRPSVARAGIAADTVLGTIPDIAVRFRDDDEARKTILVAGGTGFIGRHLVRRLVGQGHEVILWARDPLKGEFLFGPRVHCIGDLAELSPSRHLDAIVNLAGTPLLGGLWTRRRKAELIASRTETTRALVEHVARMSTPPEVLINASAIGYYGLRGDEWLDEDALPQEIFQSELCLAWEMEAQAMEAFGTRVVRLRLGLVFGRDGGAFPALSRPYRFALGAVFGHGRQWLSWIHIDDVVRLIDFALHHRELHGAVNAVAPEPVRQSDFAEALARAVEWPRWLRIPAKPLRFALGELSQLFLDGQRVSAARLLRYGFAFRFPDLTAALDDLLVTAPAPAALETLYNDRCPVCRVEIESYDRAARHRGAPMRFRPLDDETSALRRYGLTRQIARRRILAIDPSGRMLTGAEAMREIWRHLPRTRWLAHLLDYTAIFWCAHALYELAIAPTLNRLTRQDTGQGRQSKQIERRRLPQPKGSDPFKGSDPSGSHMR